MREAVDLDGERRLPPGLARVQTFEIANKFVGRVIGPGGSVINAIVEATGVSNIGIDKGEPATVTVTGTDDAGIAAAIARINEIVAEGGGALSPRGSAPRSPPAPPPPPPPPITVGEVFEQCEVKNVVPFGIFVQLQPGVDGFCHISELSEQYIKNIEDVELKAGDRLNVKVVQINKSGQYRIQVLSEFGVRPAAGRSGGKPVGGGQSAR